MMNKAGNKEMQRFKNVEQLSVAYILEELETCENSLKKLKKTLTNSNSHLNAMSKNPIENTLKFLESSRNSVESATSSAQINAAISPLFSVFLVFKEFVVATSNDIHFLTTQLEQAHVERTTLREEVANATKQPKRGRKR